MLGQRCRAPLGRVRSLGVALSVLTAVAAAAACADTADGPLVAEEPVPDTTTTSSTTVPPELPRSEGTVEIGEARYQFVVTCQERGAGEVVVIGVADDPDSDGLVELYVRASLSDPWVSLKLADGTFLDPSLDSRLDFYLQDDVIRASAIRFVRDLDYETGEATEVGFGEFEIHCYSYENELPS